MLSPNAMNRVLLNDGDLVTRTVIEHDAVRLRLSLAVQSPRVSPTGNLLPEAGVHDTVTGASPSAVEGAGYFTTASLVIVWAVTSGVHVIDGASAMATVVVVEELDVVVGVVGLLLHPDTNSNTVPNTQTSLRVQEGKRTINKNY